MDDYKVQCNWANKQGKDLKSSTIVQHLAEKSLDAPELADIVGADKSILLCGESKSCEIFIESSLTYSIQLVSIVTDCEKAEIFTGVLEEYSATVYGDFIDDFDDIKTFRYDLPAKGSRKVVFKFIQPSQQMWLFGIHISLIPNDFATSGPSSSAHSTSIPSINLENVNTILSESTYKISDKAENCKKFLEMYAKSRNANSNLFQQPSDSKDNLMNVLASTLGNLKNKNSGDEFNAQLKRIRPLETKDEEIKNYIDIKFLEIDKKIEKYLKEFEERQTEKLDQILNTLITLTNRIKDEG